MEPPEPFPRIPPTPPSQQSFQDAPTHHKVRRPVSFYENWTSDIRDDHPTKVNLKRSRTFHDPPDVRGSPSLVYTMKTTVPQSVRSSLNPERHIPTRSSLRHSRMIGLKQTCKVPHKYLPPIIRYHRVAKKLVVLQLILGVIITCISVWLVIFCSTLYTRDTPHWSGIPLILAGFSAYILLYFCRKEYPGMQLNCYMFLYKIFSISLSLITCVLCFCAAIFTIFHLTFLSYAICDSITSDSIAPGNNQSNNITQFISQSMKSTSQSNTCMCAIQSVALNPLVDNMMKMSIQSFLYPVTCADVRSKLSLVLLASGVLNGAAGVLLFYYVYLHWKSRYLYVYSHVDSAQTKPSIITNK
ncbi:hypothetical protein M8J77_021443 [Diaphorina citri]|nr:hypothetical protein M8J77_021443 [Diaphorina citri]